MSKTLAEYASHPCFGMTARKTVGRLHLPVAPRSNARIRFADAGGSKAAMAPEEAVNWLDHVMDQGKPVAIVGITGPGDPLTVPEPSLRTLRLVRDKYPDISLCLTTLGMNGAEYAEELVDLGVSHVTLLVDAVSPEVAERLYAWVRPSTRTLPLKEAVRLLITDQARAVSAFKKAGLTVKINTTVYPGYNAGHVEEIARTMGGLGADIMAVVPYHPGKDADEDVPGTNVELLAEIRDLAGRHIDIMPAWDECGENVVGLDNPGKADARIAILPKAHQGAAQRGRGQLHRHGRGPAPGPRHQGHGLRPARRRAGLPAGDPGRPGARFRVQAVGDPGRHPERLFRPAHSLGGRESQTNFEPQGSVRPDHGRRDRGNRGCALRRR